jgi:ribosome-associated protein
MQRGDGDGTYPLPPEGELDWSFVRSSGAGGQNVNKVASKAVLRWNVAHSRWLAPALRARVVARLGARLTSGGEIILTSQRHRDQARNVEDCRAKLRVLLAAATAPPPPPRRPTRPSRGAQERRLAGKHAHAERKRQRGGGGRGGDWD